MTLQITEAITGAEWWLPVPRAYWRQPWGKNAVWVGDWLAYPVLQVSWNDATKYCEVRANAKAALEYVAMIYYLVLQYGNVSKHQFIHVIIII